MMKSPYQAYASHLTSPSVEQTPSQQIKPLFPSQHGRSPYASHHDADYINLGASSAYRKATNAIQSPSAKSNTAPVLPAYDHSPFMQQSIRQAMETVENVHRSDAAESDDLEQRLTGT